MSTFKCPNCHAELPDFQHSAGFCPYCDAKWPGHTSETVPSGLDLSPSEDADNADDGLELSPEDLNAQTLELDEDGQPSPNQTIDLPGASRVGDEFIQPPGEDIGHTIEFSSEDTSGTISLDKVEGEGDGFQTLDLGKPEAGDIHSQPTMDVPPAGGEGMQTLDLEGDPNAGRDASHTLAFSVSGDDIQQTVDIGDPNRPVSDDDLNVTFGSEPLSPSDVKRYWAAGDGSPMQTMRTATVSKAKELGVDLRRRILSDQEEGSDYAIINQLGKGGMGVVYAAKQKSLRRRVAVKTLKRDIGQREDDRAKFLSEAVITGILDHPNIVPIHELGQTEDGTLFYSMKCVTGTEWHKAIRNKSEAENLDIFLKVADAMAFAHSKNVIHRDLKPENVMLGEYGEVLVMDWGLAVDLNRKEEFTMGGTPAYMAPEMAKGPLERIGKCSDIYLLGAMLYEIVTGFPPHAASTITECLVAAAQNVIVRSDSTSRLKNIALKAMATSPKLRFNSVALLQEEVRKYQSTAQSIELANTAQHELETAKEAENYELFSRAMFGFEDALKLWSENDVADRGFHEARQEYALCALKKGDFDLGLQLVSPENPDEEPIYNDLVKAKADAERTSRNAKMARFVAVGSLLFALVGASIGLLVINGLRQQAYDAAQVAIAAEQKAKDEADKATQAKEVATREKEKADSLAVDLQAEKDNLVVVNNNLDSANSRLKMLNQDLQMKTATISEQNIELETQRDAIAVQRDRLEEALVDVAQERNRALFAGMFASVGLAQSKVESNDIAAALSLLESVEEEYRGWEWKHLAYLCHPDVPHVDFQVSATAVATSIDGKWTAIGTEEDGLYLYPTSHATEKDAKANHVAMPDCRITCLRFSPDGSQLWIGTDHPAKYLQVLPLQGNLTTVELAKLNQYSTMPAVSAIEFVPGASSEVMVAVSGRCYLLDSKTLTGKSLIHAENVFDLDVSPSGKQYVHAQEFQGEYRVKRMTIDGSTQDVEELQFNDPVLHCAYLSETCVALALADGSLNLWTGPKQQDTLAFSLPAQVNQLTYDAERKLLSASLADGSLKLFQFDPQSNRLKEFKTLRGHQAAVFASAFHPEQPELVSVSEDKTARFWNYETYQDRLDLDLQNSVLWASFSQDGRQFVTGDRAGRTQVWDTTVGTDQPQLDMHVSDWTSQNIGKKAISASLADGKHVVTADPDIGITVWNLATKKAVWSTPTEGGSYRMAPIPLSDQFIYLDQSTSPQGAAGTKVIAANPQGEKLFAVDSPLEIGQVSELVVSPGGKYFAVRIPNGVRVYAMPNKADKQLGEPVWKVDSGIVQQIAFSSDSELLLGYDSGREEGYLVLYDFLKDTKIRDLPSKENGLPFLQFAVSPDLKHLVVTYNDYYANQPDQRKQTHLSLFALNNPQQALHKATCDGLAAFPSISADNQVVYFVQQHRLGDHDAARWEVSKPQCETLPYSRKGNDIVGTASREVVLVDAFPSNDNQILVSYSNRDVELWDMTAKKSLERLAPTRPVLFCDFLAHDTQIVSVHVDGLVRLWDAQSGTMLDQFDSGYQTLQAAGLNESMLAVGGSAGRIAIIDLAKKEFVQNLANTGYSIDALTWVGGKPDPVLVIASSRMQTDEDGGEHQVGSIELVDSKTWNQLGESFAVHPGRYRSLAVSQDGMRFAATSTDKRVRLWADVPVDQWSTSEPRKLEGHSTDVTGAAFSATGERLITGSFDGALTVWFIDRPELSADDAEKKDAPLPPLHVQQFVPLKGHRKEISSIAFSPDSKMLLTSSIDRSAILWFTTELPKTDAELAAQPGTLGKDAVASSEAESK
ncbi:protein kinase domain-containing protein [Bremerella cremea]|uniref:protein kinase domain-containing protein n=1 Tax=Bremerella cremea TaxID=1031537 RepID=UPI0031E57EC7